MLPAKEKFPKRVRFTFADRINNLALDIAEDIYLYWLTTPGNHHYLGNLCRSWDDALDNFHYSALTATANSAIADLLPAITDSLNEPASLDYYACIPAGLLEQLLRNVSKRGRRDQPVA